MNISKKANAILLFFSIFLGFIIVIQMKQHVESYNLVTLRSIQMTKVEISNTTKEIEEMKVIIEDKKEELERLQDISKGDKNIYEVLNEELINTKVTSGFSDMEGPGIVVKMKDSQSIEIPSSDINDKVIHDVDIQNILNDLRVGGAEAISINGQRIMPMSEIKCGGPIIKINGNSLGAPFVIKAIGNPKQLYAAINAPGTYGYALKNFYKIYIETTVEDKINIPAYSGDFNFNYAKPIKEGE